MKVTNIGTVFQLSFMPRIFPVNCYFVEEESELTLIDTALPYSTKSIINAAKKIGKPITRIIITHAHSDHIGALDMLKELLPASQVCISSRDALLLEGISTLLPNEKNTPIRGGLPKNIKTKPDLLLEEGDRVGSLEVISTPGHTPGSITLFDTRNQSLIAGDALITRGKLVVSGMMNPLFPFPALATWDKNTALESAKKLSELNPSLLAVGHGKMLMQPQELLKIAIAEAEKIFYK
ncbi:MBL fold metallo-hydrolase [Lysinibacillus pakistanensis]|uniref:MBL fold metallo-hydrolase n=1 Tax=Lysinibacillus pakistanensis TaxID=759811 RepID=A0AAX3X4E1_9BACI|nr:MBL fold metallo-hydrolase [Lysinibacillus pakistanensis]MDM5233053.1 MBL fold metallo-hydrolase [Lysinibacillus pakistanensis]WHY49153.1 MBL fold metallo-hydrolase [Lysinibacillus pakistanensis]WHY54163.1 MBL fold metallo-hydrolase [Lysinibacillus pakistanensis]